MSYIKSRKHADVRSTTKQATAVGLALASLTAFAAEPVAPANPDESTLPTLSVKGKRENGYKAEKASSPKITQPLIDTPKTIQVVKKEILAEQGAASLMDALRNTPGITMQLGEGGSTSAGDAFQMRGFSTQTSTFVDGIRDLGAVTRDVFNVEQVEIVKGPAGAEGGRGASSGYINLVSKLPSLDDLASVDVTVGTHAKKRVTADINHAFGESSAFRLNVMAQDSDTPGRDQVKSAGTGIAPSLAFGLGTPTRIYLFSQHLRQDNVPDGGIPSIGMKGFYNANPTVASAPAVRRNNYYGSERDYEKVNADMASIKFEHDVTSSVRVSNITRYGKTHMDRVLTGINAITASSNDPSTWTLARSRQRTDQTNEILANQTNVNSEFSTAGLKHALSAGLELMYERQLTRGSGTSAQTVNGVTYSAVAITAANLYNPNPGDALGTPYFTGADTEGKTLTTAVYVFDTLTLNDAWKVNAGLRLDRYNLSTNTGTIVTTGTNGNQANYPGYAVGSIAPAALKDSDNLLSWNLGAVFKPAPNGTVYAALANSQTPPGANNFTLSATSTNQANAALDPQETSNIELGTKWDLLDKRLNVSAALYRTENDKQTSTDSTGVTSQYGKTRVEGIELAAVGQLTNFWQVSAGIAKMKTKQLDQYSRNATTGVVTTTNAVRWSPDLTASVWTSYTLDQFTVGGGLNYSSSQKRVITTDTAAANMPSIPGYVVTNLFGAYKVNKNLNLQLNVNNLFDKEYLSSLNNNGSRLTLGAPRTVSLTARVLF